MRAGRRGRTLVTPLVATRCPGAGYSRGMQVLVWWIPPILATTGTVVWHWWHESKQRRIDAMPEGQRRAIELERIGEALQGLGDRAASDGTRA